MKMEHVSLTFKLMEVEMPGTEPYKVGYKKPPKETQFKKGQSGNSSGRPKGVMSRKERAALAFFYEFDTKVQVIENGKKIFVSKGQVGYKALFVKTSKGDAQAIKLMTHLHDEHSAVLARFDVREEKRKHDLKFEGYTLDDKRKLLKLHRDTNELHDEVAAKRNEKP